MKTHWNLVLSFGQRRLLDTGPVSQLVVHSLENRTRIGLILAFNVSLIINTDLIVVEIVCLRLGAEVAVDFCFGLPGLELSNHGVVSQQMNLWLPRKHRSQFLRWNGAGIC